MHLQCSFQNKECLLRLNKRKQILDAFLYQTLSIILLALHPSPVKSSLPCPMHCSNPWSTFSNHVSLVITDGCEQQCGPDPRPRLSKLQRFSSPCLVWFITATGVSYRVLSALPSISGILSVSTWLQTSPRSQLDELCMVFSHRQKRWIKKKKNTHFLSQRSFHLEVQQSGRRKKWCAIGALLRANLTGESGLLWL